MKVNLVKLRKPEHFHVLCIDYGTNVQTVTKMLNEH